MQTIETPNTDKVNTQEVIDALPTASTDLLVEQSIRVIGGQLSVNARLLFGFVLREISADDGDYVVQSMRGELAELQERCADLEASLAKETTIWSDLAKALDLTEEEATEATVYRALGEQKTALSEAHSLIERSTKELAKSFGDPEVQTKAHPLEDVVRHAKGKLQKELAEVGSKAQELRKTNSDLVTEILKANKELVKVFDAAPGVPAEATLFELFSAQIAHSVKKHLDGPDSTHPEFVEKQKALPDHLKANYQHFLGLFADAAGATGSPNLEEVLALVVSRGHHLGELQKEKQNLEFQLKDRKETQANLEARIQELERAKAAQPSKPVSTAVDKLSAADRAAWIQDAMSSAPGLPGKLKDPLAMVQAVKGIYGGDTESEVARYLGLSIDVVRESYMPFLQHHADKRREIQVPAYRQEYDAALQADVRRYQESPGKGKAAK